MLVSTKVLSFMPFVPAAANHAPQMKALIKQSGGLPLSAFVSFLLSDQNLDLLGQQAADGGTTTGGKDFGLSQRLLTQANCHILLGRSVRVARDIRVFKRSS